MFNSIFRYRGWLVLMCCLAICTLTTSIYAQNGVAESAGGQSNPANLYWIIGTIIFLLVVIVGFLLYMYTLQKRFFEACMADDHLALFFQSPAGLPAGTVRSVLALIIVTISLYFITLAVFGVTEGRSPEMLTGILGAVIGFYFGGRSASRGEEKVLSNKVKEVRTEQNTVIKERDAAVKEREAAVQEREAAVQERDQATKEKDTSQAEALLSKVQKVTGLAKMVSAILPTDLKSKFDDVTNKLEQGVNIIENLSKIGDVAGVVTKGTEVFDLFKGDNPVRSIIEQATRSFGKVLGGAVPPLALISTIVGVTTTLAGGAYARWKARILNLPFSPTVAPLKLVDADTGQLLIIQSTILKAAFLQKIKEDDRPFMAGVYKDFITQEKSELWKKYGEYFDSQEDFENGVEGFRREAANLELPSEIEPTLLKEVGNYDSLMTSIDKIQQDDKAGGDLDLLMEVVEGLQKENQPVRDIFDKVRKEIDS